MQQSATSPLQDADREVDVSVIIPTFNGAARIGRCLQALQSQVNAFSAEILVVDDGSTDDTASVARSFQNVRVISQANAGPAAARNRGAQQARGSILLFTDDDCVPFPDWLQKMLAPFADPALVGDKGVYRTLQRELTARFVQLEYEDKYRIMSSQTSIDFIDTYSAGFRRDRFLEIGGYDTLFPVACAEDVELSFRMSARKWPMRFVPSAIVYHSHPDKAFAYFRKKYKFAFWRMLAVRKNPEKAVKDSHTPQLMKLQLLLLPALVGGVVVGAVLGRVAQMVAVVLFAFLLTTLPFLFRAMRKDPMIGLLSPLFLAGRAVAQFLGVAGGVLYTLRHRSQANAVSRAG